MSSSPGSIQDISDRLAESFCHSVDLHTSGAKGRRRPSAKEIEATSAEAVRRFLATAREERTRHRLGLIARARVAFRVQQRLLAAGYPASLVKQVLFAMLVSAFVGDKQ